MSDIVIRRGLIEIANFHYNGGKDRFPRVLILDSFDSSLGNLIYCGINLNYLGMEDRQDLYSHLEELAEEWPNLRGDMCLAILADQTTFQGAYRKYLATKVSGVSVIEHVEVEV